MGSTVNVDRAPCPQSDESVEERRASYFKPSSKRSRTAVVLRQRVGPNSIGTADSKLASPIGSRVAPSLRASSN